MSAKNDLSMELEFTAAYRRTEGMDIALREAECLRAQFPAILSPLQEGDRLAGRVSWGAVGFSPHNGPPDCGYAYFCNEQQVIDSIEAGNIPRAQRDGVMEMLHYWRREASQHKVEAAFTARMDQVFTRDEVVPLPCNVRPLVAMPLFRMAGVFLDYAKLLRLGLPGLKSEAEAYARGAEQAGGDASLFIGMAKAVDVVMSVCGFYHEQALRGSSARPETARAEQLRALADVLSALTERKPTTFVEALQLTWIYTLVCGSLELGRMDTYLGDLFVHDIDNGILTEAEAESHLHSLWTLINDLFRVVDGRIIIGGKGRTNEENADRLALFIMQAARSYGRSVLPQLTLRFHDGMNPQLMQSALSMIADGYTYPLLYNDDVMVPAVEKAHKLPAKVAEQYVPLGCGEIVLDHMGYGTPSGALNVLKALEITLHDGRDPITGKQLGLHTGELYSFHSYDELWSALKKQLTYFIEVLAEQEALEYKVTGKIAPFLLLSMLYDDCMERGQGMFSGGVRYLGGSLETYGNVNTADSLTAIRCAVFKNRQITLNELVTVLDHNFVGHDAIRALLRDQPKYGNDHAEADGTVTELHDFLCNTIRDQAQRVGLDWYLNVIINNSQNTTLGRWVGASADGRSSGAAMANANTPSGGSDRKGITALINSIVKPNPRIHAGAVQNLRFGRDVVTHDRVKFELILKTYFAKGGSQAMVTVIGRGDLEKALDEPEKYRHLVVRVGGFSARFVELSKDVQLEILSRTTY